MNDFTKFHVTPFNICWGTDISVWTSGCRRCVKVCLVSLRTNHKHQWPSVHSCLMFDFLKNPVHQTKSWIIHHNSTELRPHLRLFFNSHVEWSVAKCLHVFLYWIRSSVIHFGGLSLWKHQLSQCSGHRGYSIALTNGDFKFKPKLYRWSFSHSRPSSQLLNHLVLFKLSLFRGKLPTLTWPDLNMNCNTHGFATASNT